MYTDSKVLAKKNESLRYGPASSESNSHLFSAIQHISLVH